MPQSALFLEDLFRRAGFPEGSFQTLLIGSAEVEGVISDPRVRAVTLTGSEAAGRAVAAVAGRELKKSVLELGGSDPFVVMPSANIDEAAAVATTARCQNNGQSCIAAKRFIVHTDIYDAFTAAFVAKMSALRVGDPMVAGTDIGPLATEQGRADIEEQVRDAVAKGASVLCGGARLDQPGWWYQPTVVADLTPDMKMYAEEVFGPVAGLYRGELTRGGSRTRQQHRVRSRVERLDQRPGRAGVLHQRSRRRRRVHQRHDDVIRRTAVRRCAQLRLRP